MWLKLSREGLVTYLPVFPWHEKIRRIRSWKTNVNTLKSFQPKHLRHCCSVWLPNLQQSGWVHERNFQWTAVTTLKPGLIFFRNFLPSRCKSDSAAFAQQSIWLLLAFGDAACVAFRVFGLSSAAVCVCCRLWLAVVVGVCLLALWGFCSPWGVFRFCFGGFCPPLFCFFLLAAAVDFCPLMLVAAVVCFLFWCPVASARPGVSFFWWLCLVFVVWCSGLPGASAALGCLRSLSLLWLALVFLGLWCFFVFFPWVVVLVFVFWRYGASACFAAFLFLLVAAVGMGPSHSAACADVWCCVLRFGVCPPWGLGRFVSFCCHAVQFLILLLFLSFIFFFLSFLSSFLPSFSVGWCVALWDFRLPALFSVPVVGGGWCLLFWRCGASARPGVFVFFPEWLWFVVGVCLLALWDFCPRWGILFFVWVFCPSVVSLFFLVAVAGNCSLLLVAAAGVSLLGALWLLPGLGCFWFGGWGRCFFWLAFWAPGLSPFVFVVVIGVSFFGALGLLPALWCSSSSLEWLWFGVVCLSALWGFRPLWGVYLPFGGCGWHAGASACFAVFLVPFGCCVGHLSFGASSLLVSSARSIFPSLVWATWS